MRVLLLSPYRKSLLGTLRGAGDTPIECNEKSENWPNDFDFIVSYGYRHIIRPSVIDCYRDRIINIHISLLPWNRGSDTNLWSWYDDTPKGVSIHYIDEGIDTGDILAQQQLTRWKDADTLTSTWSTLMAEGKHLFDRTWSRIRDGRMPPVKQITDGTYHRSADKDRLMALLPDKWDTNVKEVTDLGKRHREEAAKEDCGLRAREHRHPSP